MCGCRCCACAAHIVVCRAVLLLQLLGIPAQKFTQLDLSVAVGVRAAVGRDEDILDHALGRGLTEALEHVCEFAPVNGTRAVLVGLEEGRLRLREFRVGEGRAHGIRGRRVLRRRSERGGGVSVWQGTCERGAHTS